MRIGKETYLGDGLYASFNEETRSIILRAPRLQGDHWVALDPSVLQALVKFVDTLITTRMQGDKDDEPHDLH